MDHIKYFFQTFLKPKIEKCFPQTHPMEYLELICKKNLKNFFRNVVHKKVCSLNTYVLYRNKNIL